MMHISEHIEVVEYGGVLVNNELLVIGDLHLGHERDLINSGIFIPRFQLEDILKRLRIIFEKVKPKRILLNGDVKHLFGSINRQEWNDIRKLLSVCEEYCEELIIVRGNHDNYLQTIVKSNKVRFFEEWFIAENRIAIGHGHKEIDPKKYDAIIIGNEHPAISVGSGIGDDQKFPCAIYGKIGKCLLVVCPAFSPLALGVDVLRANRWLSPIMKKAKLDKFKVIAVDEENVLEFPEIGKIKKRNRHI